MNNFSKRERGSDTGLYSARSLYCRQAHHPRPYASQAAPRRISPKTLPLQAPPPPLRGWMDKPAPIERRNHDERRNAAVEHCN